MYVLPSFDGELQHTSFNWKTLDSKSIIQMISALNLEFELVRSPRVLCILKKLNKGFMNLQSGKKILQKCSTHFFLPDLREFYFQSKYVYVLAF